MIHPIWYFLFYFMNKFYILWFPQPLL